MQFSCLSLLSAGIEDVFHHHDLLYWHSCWKLRGYRWGIMDLDHCDLRHQVEILKIALSSTHPRKGRESYWKLECLSIRWPCSCLRSFKEQGAGRDELWSLFQSQGYVVVKGEIKRNKAWGPWPGFSSLINLLLCPASSLSLPINLHWLPAGTEGPIDLILFSSLQVRNGVLRLAKA